mmetsp:Transcript_25952/g.48739  ORF Transcript_25952/g.48739 Transcript_25952/m.48739 type:complete len:86 (-) Transcript_25952:324-581(-)
MPKVFAYSQMRTFVLKAHRYRFPHRLATSQRMAQVLQGVKSKNVILERIVSMVSFETVLLGDMVIHTNYLIPSALDPAGRGITAL